VTFADEREYVVGVLRATGGQYTMLSAFRLFLMTHAPDPGPGFDNCPTVYNPDQTDNDHDGIGDAIEEATLRPLAASLARNVSGQLSATLAGGTGEPLRDQVVRFTFDADGDGTVEEYTAITDTAGSATATVFATRPVGGTTFDTSWDGPLGTITATGDVTVADATALTLADALQTRSTAATAVATLTDSDGIGIPGATVTFWIELKVKSSATWVQFGSAVTDADGVVSAPVPVKYVSRQTRPIMAEYAGDGLRAPATASAITQRI
jgi:hypothetical protein